MYKNQQDKIGDNEEKIFNINWTVDEIMMRRWWWWSKFLNYFGAVENNGWDFWKFEQLDQEMKTLSFLEVKRVLQILSGNIAGCGEVWVIMMIWKPEKRKSEHCLGG